MPKVRSIKEIVNWAKESLGLQRKIAIHPNHIIEQNVINRQPENGAGGDFGKIQFGAKRELIDRARAKGFAGRHPRPRAVGAAEIKLAHIEAAFAAVQHKQLAVVGAAAKDAAQIIVIQPIMFHRDIEGGAAVRPHAEAADTDLGFDRAIQRQQIRHKRFLPVNIRERADKAGKAVFRQRQPRADIDDEVLVIEAQTERRVADGFAFGPHGVLIQFAKCERQLADELHIFVNWQRHGDEPGGSKRRRLAGRRIAGPEFKLRMQSFDAQRLRRRESRQQQQKTDYTHKTFHGRSPSGVGIHASSCEACRGTASSRLRNYRWRVSNYECNHFAENVKSYFV